MLKKIIPDPTLWLKELVAATLNTHLSPIRAEMGRLLQDTAYLGMKIYSLSINQTSVNGRFGSGYVSEKLSLFKSDSS